MQDLPQSGMGMTRIADSARSHLSVECVWSIRARGILVAQRKNLWTTYGLTLLASGMVPSNLYLCVENPGISIVSTMSSGVSSVTLSSQAHQAGDTQLVLSVGLASQEVVTFSSAAAGGGSTWVYTLSSPTVQPHTSGDIACRQVVVGDTMTNVVSEQQYDSVNFPNQRMTIASGYSGGAGNWVYQFFYPGPLLQTTLVMVGVSDSPTIGTGNLLNHFTLGYNHNSTTNDLEVDGSLTLTNV